MAISTHTTTGPATTAVNNTTQALRRVLIDRRRELLNEIQHKIKEVRAEASTASRPTDADETTTVEPEDDLTFALLQMKSHMLNRINVAVRRLDEGSYGYCIDCEESIAPSRLHALPFAVRCRCCEDRRERSDRLQSTEAPWSSADPGFATH